MRWLEVEGPLIEQWPSAGHDLLFGDLPLKEVPSADGNSAPATVVESQNRERDAERLLRHFLSQAYRRPFDNEDLQRFLPVARRVWESGGSFTDAMITAYTAVLSSPKFLTFPEHPGVSQADV